MSDLQLVCAGIQSEVAQLEKRRLSLGKFIREPKKYLIAIQQMKHLPPPSYSSETYIFSLTVLQSFTLI